MIKRRGRLPFQYTLGEGNVGLPSNWIIVRERLEHDFGP
jgi:hypothetical protein